MEQGARTVVYFGGQSMLGAGLYEPYPQTLVMSEGAAGGGAGH